MSKSDKTLWDIAIEQAENNEATGQGEEKSVFVLGSKNAGKTSMILRFQDRDEAPKPTTALEYTFARRAKGHNLCGDRLYTSVSDIYRHQILTYKGVPHSDKIKNILVIFSGYLAKDVGHIWELGGGTWLSRLIEVPITVDTIRNTSVILVVDLSKPNELWFTLEKLLTSTSARVESIINDLRGVDPDIKNVMRKTAWERIGNTHPDKEKIEPFLIPLVIIGSKYDLFQFFSTKHEALVKRARSLTSHLVFGTDFLKKADVDYNKPLLITYGQDTSEQIGAPPMAEGDLGKVMARSPLDLWKQAYIGNFPQESISDPSLVEDPAKDKQYSEPAVDDMRVQKDQELERYRRMSERRMKEMNKRAVAEGQA